MDYLMFNREKIGEELTLLPVNHRITFAASCCERLLPNYLAFSQMEKWGKPLMLREVLDSIWSYLEGTNLSEAEIKTKRHICGTIAPDEEDFSSIFTSVALNAVAAVDLTLESILEQDSEQVAVVAELAFDSVFDYVRIVNDP